jgi:hypothetical protein
MIKKYWKFIRESIKEDIDDGKFWKLDEDDIREFLIDLDDENYLTTVTFGFVNEEESYNYKVNKTTTSQVFTEKVIPGDDIRPAYWILIETGRDTSSVDVTDSVIFAHDIIKEKVDGEITIHDEDGRLDINNIQLKGGLWIGKDESGNQKGEIFFKHSEQLEAKEYIALFVKQKNTVELTQKQVADYYGLAYDKEDKSGGIYIHVDLEDMADCLLDRNDDYKETLVGGMEHMWDRYESHYYFPETSSFFQYSLDKENEVLMVKSIIKEMGGLEELLTEVHFDEDMSNKSEDEVIDFLLKERFYDILNELCRDSEITQEAKQIVADWEMGAHVDDVYDNILNSFDKKVDEEFNYQKVNIDQKINSYTQSVTYYEVEFDSKWMDDFDSDDLFRESSIRNLWDEWCGQQWFSETLNPRIPDYGSADDKGINSDIKHLLDNYLKDH